MCTEVDESIWILIAEIFQMISKQFVLESDAITYENEELAEELKKKKWDLNSMSSNAQY